MTSVGPQQVRALAPEVRVLDVRDAASFAAGHVAGSGHVPLGQLAARRHELPEPSTPLLVLGEDAAQAQRAAEALGVLGYRDVRWLEAPWSELDGAHETGPAARLWRPTPYLEQVLASIPRGRALDVASGAGRDAVFLALEGFEVEAIDVDSDALARAADLARRHQARVAIRRVDLERADARLTPQRYALVTCFRFLHRPLLPAIAAALAPGGHLVLETFRAGQERWGKPRRPQFLLQPGELRSAFPDLETLHVEELEPEGGPVVARLHARRPRFAREQSEA